MLKKHTTAWILVLGLGGISSAWPEESSINPNWVFCPDALGIPQRPLIDDNLKADDILITADEAELVDEGVSDLRGRVEITQDQQQIQSDQVLYDKTDNSADLNGHVKYWDNALFVDGDTAHVELNDSAALFNDAHYLIIDNRGRGRADSIETISGVSTTLKTVDFSTCQPDDNFWKLKASKITLDHEKEKVVGRNVTLKIKDIPVFYTPYISFPLSDARKSGFLAPSIGNSNRNGFELATPYYWNIAPNQDATLTPKLLTDSGVFLNGEYRYLFQRGSGQVNLEYLPSDNNFNNEDRNLFSFKHQQGFLNTGYLSLDYNRVSDSQYFTDFGTDISLTSTQFLLQQALASYAGSWWNGSILVQNFQTVDRTLPAASRPFKRLPQFNFNAFNHHRNQQLNFSFQSQLVYFDRSDSSGISTDDNAIRLDLYPSISYPFRSLAGYIEPKVGVRYTQYSIQNPSNFDSSPSRTTPILSLDSGLFFDRDTNLFGKRLRQTLEPQLYYLYIPEDEQDDLPIFDTGVFDFSYSSLFRENRFSGVDRLGDANQVTLALTSRLINQETGDEVGFVRFGQIYFIDDRDTTLPNLANNAESSSPLVAELQYNLNKNWKIRSEYQWDPDQNRTQKLTGQVQYKSQSGIILNLSYRVRRDQQLFLTSRFNDIEQSDISFNYPVTKRLNIVGRWNHAVPENRSINAFAGIEYQDCCWGISLVGRRFLTDITGEQQTGVFLQFELKGLAGVGKKTTEFLKQNIRGYDSDF